MKFSIVIPVYNVRSYLFDCVDSVLKQTYTDFEVLLVDDGSTDGSGDLCDDYAARDGRVKVIHKKNGGPSSARNAGIERAAGEYVLFLDGDDYWLMPEVLALLAEKLEEKAVDVLCFNFCKETDGVCGRPYFGTTVCVDGGTDVDYMRVNRLWISPAWNKVIRTALFRTGDLFFAEVINSEDVDWSARLAVAAESFGYADVCALAYRQRNGSGSHSMTYDKTKCLKGNVEAVRSIVENADGTKKELLFPYLAYQVAILLWNAAILPDNEKKEELVKEIEPLAVYLAYADGKKGRVLYRVYRCFGYHGLVKALWMRAKL